jgi:membrane protease YdiL (CAAX protease family)
MSSARATPPGFWTTVGLLLAISRKRALGRARRQRQLFRMRSYLQGNDWQPLIIVLSILFMAVANILAALLVQGAVTSGERVEIERQGKVVVDEWFAAKSREAQARAGTSPSALQEIDRSLRPYYSIEAFRIAKDFGGDKDAIADKLRDVARNRGAADFIELKRAAPGLAALPRFGALPAMLGSIAVLWWSVMLILQSEGLELDTQRRRHPMWEWLFSHPVPPGAIFLAEMLSPLAANPIYYSAPLFPGILYGAVYGWRLGVVAAFLIGVPIALAAGCVGKAIEIGVMLRFSPRSRGAIIGLMGSISAISLTLVVIGFASIQRAAASLAGLLQPFSGMAWPWLGIFLGQRADGSFSFPIGMLSCWAVAAASIGGSIGFSVWAARSGLSGKVSPADTAPKPATAAGVRFGGRDPLYRKELLWFARDRSAILQAVLIPLTFAGVQLINMRDFLAIAAGQWNFICGAGILFGTYFLTMLGPRSLASEGTALWIALTWPRGLESLLKAKARLWSLIATAIVGLVFGYAVWLYPANGWKIALVGLGWSVFARSLAEKAVTLASVASESGETQKISWGRRWAVTLGTLTFAIGVFTQQWAMAIAGIFYSAMTAAAMWQNFRARLPYLYDPWSEKLPRPPTLMHAMIAISCLVEGTAVLMSVVLIFIGRDNIAVAQAMSYGVSAIIVALGLTNFLRNRGVPLAAIWLWRKPDNEHAAAERRWRPASEATGNLKSSLLAAVALGLALGLLAHGYLALLHQFPLTAQLLNDAEARRAAIPHVRTAYFVLAVLFAPAAEEYLFRGLLYRVLDREWGGWLAVACSAAFFAIYHPLLSWLPVGLLGMTNALLFKRTGNLAPAVLLHMVYNAVVLS